MNKTDQDQSQPQPEKRVTPPVILVAPHGESVVWSLRDTGHNSKWMEAGWTRADDRAAAIKAAQTILDRFSLVTKPVVENAPESILPQVVRRGGHKETEGRFSDDGANIDFMGVSPIEGAGKVHGLPACYRARGRTWELVIDLGSGDPQEHAGVHLGDFHGETWTYREHCYAWPDGGYIHRDESIANITKAVELFRNRFLREETWKAHRDAIVKGGT